MEGGQGQALDDFIESIQIILLQFVINIWQFLPSTYFIFPHRYSFEKLVDDGFWFLFQKYQREAQNGSQFFNEGWNLGLDDGWGVVFFVFLGE